MVYREGLVRSSSRRADGTGHLKEAYIDINLGYNPPALGGQLRQRRRFRDQPNIDESEP